MRLRKFEIAEHANQQTSQLIKVVGTSDMHVLLDRDFFALIDTLRTKNHYRYLWSMVRSLANPFCGHDDFVR